MLVYCLGNQHKRISLCIVRIHTILLQVLSVQDSLRSQMWTSETQVGTSPKLKLVSRTTMGKSLPPLHLLVLCLLWDSKLLYDPHCLNHLLWLQGANSDVSKGLSSGSIQSALETSSGHNAMEPGTGLFLVAPWHWPKALPCWFSAGLNTQSAAPKSPLSLPVPSGFVFLLECQPMPIRPLESHVISLACALCMWAREDLQILSL